MKASAWRAALATALAVAAAPGLAAPRVAVDIAPVHSIVARVMAGVGAPQLIVPPGVSEHDYALRPSEAATLQAAEAVVWIGPDHTPWLAGPLAALAPDARLVTLAEAPGAVRLPVRAGGPYEAHAHGHDDDHGDDGHGHDVEHAHSDHDEPLDGHMWLDPVNAVAFAEATAAALAELDPENAAAYRANAAALADEIAALTEAIEARLAPARGRPFIVFHDAYQYFEARFRMPAAGSVALVEGAPPGAARVAEIRDRLREAGVVCAFAEPQFDPKLLAAILEGSAVDTGALDPIGAAMPLGPELYPALLRGLADALAGCLGG